MDESSEQKAERLARELSSMTDIPYEECFDAAREAVKRLEFMAVLRIKPWPPQEFESN